MSCGIFNALNNVIQLLLRLISLTELITPWITQYWRAVCKITHMTVSSRKSRSTKIYIDCQLVIAFTFSRNGEGMNYCRMIYSKIIDSNLSRFVQFVTHFFALLPLSQTWDKYQDSHKIYEHDTSENTRCAKDQASSALNRHHQFLLINACYTECCSSWVLDSCFTVVSIHVIHSDRTNPESRSPETALISAGR